jgi:hypothetical protein
MCDRSHAEEKISMDFPFKQEFPDNLTNKAWQKEKSLKDKVMSSSKTGIGDQLTRLEAAWKKIEFEVLDPKIYETKNLNDTSSPEAMTKAKQAAQKASGGTLKEVSQLLTGVGSSAKKESDNKSLSKDAKAALVAISANAYALAKKVDSYTANIFDEDIDKAQKQVDKIMADYTAAADQTEKLFRLLQASPITKTWELALPRFSKLFSQMQSATGSFSRQPGPKMAGWANASKALREIEAKIPPIVIASKGKDVAATKVAIEDFVKVGMQQSVVFKKAA